MNEIEQNKWYEIPELLPIKVSGGELSALLEMVNSDGWSVYKKIRDFQARASACVALNPSSPSELCQTHRAIWFAIAGELEFGPRLKELAKTAVGVTIEDIEVDDADDVDAPIPTRKEFDKADKR